MYVLDTKEQSVRIKMLLSALKNVAKVLILSKRAIKIEPEETHSIAQKRRKINKNRPMETTFQSLSVCLSV